MTVRIITVGDNGMTSNTKAVYAAMKKVPDVTRFIHVGDTGYEHEARTWCGIHSQYWSAQEVADKWRIVKGNHDTSTSEALQTQIDLENYFKRLKRITYKEPDEATYNKNVR